MAKINMNEIKKNTDNASQVEELKKAEQTEAPAELSESTDNASEEAKNTSETKEQTKSNKAKAGKVVVTYIGSGIWKDSANKLWASTNKTGNILCERQYTAEEYDAREDIKFMVSYGSMKATHVE